jgi:hypothetical protein
MLSNFRMQDERRAVLERVARGELSPAEAASLLEEIDAGGAAERDPRDWAADWVEPAEKSEPQAPPPPVAGAGATRIRVVCSIGTADVVGDPTVREAVAEGPHLARREGDTLIIEGQPGGLEMGPGFMFDWAEGRRERHERHLRMRQMRRNRGWGDVTHMRVRVNPDLALDADTQAGRLRVRGVHGPIRAHVQAGGLDISDFRSPFDVNVQAGSVNARGTLDGGASRVNCEAGSVRINLERGSSVRVSAHTTLGKVVFDGDARSPWVVGNGEGTLDISGTMGSVRVSAD